MAKQVRVLGTTDETSICECCGKTNLKKVVVLEIEGEIVRYGCDCAGKALRHTGYYAGQKVKAAAIWETARWAMAPQERREMAGYNAEAFKFQAAA
jgi:ribosome-binding protein aMBF1 (putative translation factor)